MKNGIDIHGNKIYYTNASKYERYLCPYCTEPLSLRGGKKPCFAHNIIKERTPLQRTCPEYHENENCKKVKGIADIVYIDNGGIPLYLCNDGDRFELRAYFPSISEEAKKTLESNKTAIIIDSKKWCYVENINYYTVYDIKKWIDVKVTPNTSLEEVKRKWLWGIRGIDIEKDIYNCSNDSGCRVAIKSKIYVGKNYRMIFLKTIPDINGIGFKKIGTIKLKKFKIENIFQVCEMNIKEYTDEARQFIEGKGYHLAKKISDVVPLWPPAISNGNELNYDSDTAWFYHSNNNDNEYIYKMNGEKVNNIYGKNILKISKMSQGNEYIIVISNSLNLNKEIHSSYAEIKYILNYKEKLSNTKFIQPKILIKDIEGNEADFNKRILPKDRKLIIDSNIPITTRLMKENYCTYSGNNILENITYNQEIVIDCKGFGSIIYKYPDNNIHMENINEFSWYEIYKELYRCTGVMVMPGYKEKIFLYRLRKNLNIQNKNIYRILSKWICNNNIPIDAQVIINKFIGGTVND